MMFRKSILSVGIFGLGAILLFERPALAQPSGAAEGLIKTEDLSPGEQFLSLKDLVEQTLHNNNELKAMAAGVEGEQALVGPAGSLDDPMLEVQAMNFPVDSFSRRESEMTGVQVGLSQRIPFPGKRAKLREAARYSALAAKDLFEQRKWQIILRLKGVFYGLFLDHQKQALLEDQKTIIRQLIATSRSAYALGKVPQAAVLNLQVEEANLIEELLKVSSDIEAKGNELSHLVGHSGHHRLGRPEEIKLTELDPKWDEKKLISFVVENSPRLKALEHRLQAEEAELAYAKKGYLPDFEVMAGYTFREPTVTGGAGEDFVSVGVGISVPIWGASKQSNLIDAAVAGKTKTQAEYQDMKLMLEHEVRVAIAELQEAEKRVDLFKGGLLHLTQQAVASSQSAYLTGKVGYSDLLEALRTQYNTQYAYQEALAKHELKIAQLEALAAQDLGVK